MVATPKVSNALWSAAATARLQQIEGGGDIHGDDDPIRFDADELRRLAHAYTPPKGNA
jgi:hypothetical protein